LLVGDMDLKEFYEYHYEDFVKNSPVDNSWVWTRYVLV
jgi:hypothetical protein